MKYIIEISGYATELSVGTVKDKIFNFKIKFEKNFFQT